MKKAIGFIPVRLSATRFPNKPIQIVNGKTVVEWVYINAKQSKQLDEIIILTEDQQIIDIAKSFGAKAIMTNNTFASGTERIASVLDKFSEYDIILNVQGDEPLVKSIDLDNLVESFKNSPSQKLATLIKKISPKEIDNPNVVKIVLDKNKNIIYFSRSTIPFNRSGKEFAYMKHIGIYAYTREMLLGYNALETSEIEKIESLEQLRFTFNGFVFRGVLTENEYIAVDTKEDLSQVEQWQKLNNRSI